MEVLSLLSPWEGYIAQGSLKKSSAHNPFFTIVCPQSGWGVSRVMKQALLFASKIHILVCPLTLKFYICGIVVGWIIALQICPHPQTAVIGCYCLNGKLVQVSWCLRQNSRFCILLLGSAMPVEDWVIWRVGLRARAASNYRTDMKYLEGLLNSKFSSPVGGAGTNAMKSKHPFCAIPGGKYQLSLFY